MEPTIEVINLLEKQIAILNFNARKNNSFYKINIGLESVTFAIDKVNDQAKITYKTFDRNETIFTSVGDARLVYRYYQDLSKAD